MSNSNGNAKAVKSYKGFEEGSYAARKGRICFIKKIHFEMHPPSVTVQMMDTDSEVGTEFDRLQHIESWFCDTCSAQNKDIATNKCCFCKFNRSYKEKITVKQTQEQQQEEKQPEEPPKLEPTQESQQSEDTEPEHSEPDDNDTDNDIEHEEYYDDEDGEYEDDQYEHNQYEDNLYDKGNFFYFWQ